MVEGSERSEKSDSRSKTPRSKISDNVGDKLLETKKSDPGGISRYG